MFYRYKQSDGTVQAQFGEIKNRGSENEYLDVRGSYSWISPDGVRHSFSYVANEDGYQPEDLGGLDEEEEGPGAVPIPKEVLESSLG